jgi:CHAT domain-containing protein/Tfp pilus assembly protein PilF
VKTTISGIIGLIWFAAFGFPGLAQSPTDIRSLLPNQPIERELKGDEAHSYTIAVRSGQYLHVVVDQRGIDVVVTLFGADGKKVIEVDSPNGTQGPEPISVIVETTGNYRLEILSLEKMATAGKYEVRIEEFRVATEKDKTRITAEGLFSKGELLRLQKTTESLQIAIKKYEEALRLFRDLGDKPREAITMTKLGTVNTFLGNNKAALDYFLRALPVYKELKDPQKEALALNDVGGAYSSLGDSNTSLEYFRQAQPILVSLKDRNNEAVVLNNIGLVYLSLSDRQNALEYFQKARMLFIATRNRGREALVVTNIGGVYDELGDERSAIEYYQKALPIFEELKDIRSEAVILNNIGGSYEDLSDELHALEYFNRALEKYKTIQDKLLQATTLHNIGLAYYRLGDMQLALKSYEQALLLRRASGDKRGEAWTLNNLGVVYDKLDDKHKALEYYHQALLLWKIVGELGGEANTEISLMRDYQQLNNNRLGIFYGKLSANTYQRLRSNIQSMDKAIQKSYLKSVERTYRNLAALLISQGRTTEAQQVLNAFKDQEFFDSTQTKPKQLSAIAVTPRESDLMLRFERLSKNLDKSRMQISVFKRKLGPGKSIAEANELERFESELKSASEEFSAFLKHIELEFSQTPDDKDKPGEIADTIEMQTALRDLRSQTGQKVAAIYTLEAEKYYCGLIITPDKIVSFSYPINIQDLRQKELEYVNHLNKSTAQTKLPQFTRSEIEKEGKELYKIIFAPIASKLKGLNIKPDVLMWSLDGALRYLPVAALYDGKHFLAERYRNVVFTRADPERMLAQVSPKWTGSGFYNSKEYTVPLNGQMKRFAGLENAKTELENIFGVPPASGNVKGTFSANEQFTKNALFENLRRHSPLVHIASHFWLEPGDANSSFLLLGDGSKMTLEDFKIAPDDLFSGVELLTLSACETGVEKERESDGREIDSFAELTQRKGAKAVLASLWKVDDKSTSELMTRFYEARESKNLTKAEALQKAQLVLLKSKDYSHPYYWAPFILVGNWR